MPIFPIQVDLINNFIALALGDEIQATDHDDLIFLKRIKFLLEGVTIQKDLAYIILTIENLKITSTWFSTSSLLQTLQKNNAELLSDIDPQIIEITSKRETTIKKNFIDRDKLENFLVRLHKNLLQVYNCLYVDVQLKKDIDEANNGKEDNVGIKDFHRDLILEGYETRNKGGNTILEMIQTFTHHNETLTRFLQHYGGQNLVFPLINTLVRLKLLNGAGIQKNQMAWSTSQDGSLIFTNRFFLFSIPDPNDTGYYYHFTRNQNGEFIYSHICDISDEARLIERANIQQPNLAEPVIQIDNLQMPLQLLVRTELQIKLTEQNGKAQTDILGFDLITYFDEQDIPTPQATPSFRR